MNQLNGRDLRNLHFKWSRNNSPVFHVKEGEEFEVIIPDSSTMQISRNSTLSQMRSIDSSLFDGAVGPIYVEGANPGDSIEVTIKKMETDSWGWTGIMNDFGLLKNRYRETLLFWNIGKGEILSEGDLLKGIRIKASPFLGVIGTAPAEGEYGMIPPQYFGGNMDNRFVSEGSRITLPVSVEGGLLSFSDPHGSQGDGEICGTAVETGARIVAEVKIERKRKIRSPVIISRKKEEGEVIISTGIGPDLYKCSTEAALSMISILSEKGLTEEEAYILCSVAGNLHISEIVDEPNFVVSMELPSYLLNMI